MPFRSLNEVFDPF